MKRLKHMISNAGGIGGSEDNVVAITLLCVLVPVIVILMALIILAVTDLFLIPFVMGATIVGAIAYGFWLDSRED